MIECSAKIYIFQRNGVYKMGRYREVKTEKEAGKDARRYASTIWWLLWAFCFFILVYTGGMQFSEYKNIKDAKSVVAKYTSGDGFEHALLTDEDGRFHSFDITGMGAEHEGESIVLYYKDDINLAQPRVGMATWIRSYVIFGIALILLSIRLIFIYRADHSVYDAESFAKDDR